MNRTISVVTLVVAMQAWADTPPKLVEVTPTADSRAGRTATKETLTGTLAPAKTLPLGFELGGRLAATRVNKGDAVKLGQLLGSLDAEIVDAQVAQAEAGVMAAEAAAGLALEVAGKNEKLKSEGSVSDLQNRQADTQSRASQAQVLQAKAALAQAKAARRRHDLRASAAGVLVEAPEQAGFLVAPGTPLYVIQQVDVLVLKTTVAESMRSALTVGMKVRVESIGSTASTDEATLKLILPSADPQSRRIPVEFTVPNKDFRFTANTLGRAVVQVNVAKFLGVVPLTALGSAGGDHVFVLESDASLRKVPVTVVQRTKSDATISASEPLKSVVDDASSGWVDGQKVSKR
jgi:membrane fusion protein, multidrug efflux system